MLATVSCSGELTVTRGGGGSAAAGVTSLRQARSAPRATKAARTAATAQAIPLLRRRTGARPSPAAGARAAMSGSVTVIWDI